MPLFQVLLLLIYLQPQQGTPVLVHMIQISVVIKLLILLSQNLCALCLVYILVFLF